MKETDGRKIPRDQRPKPTTGQSAPERELPWDGLSDDERAVVKALNNGGSGSRVTRTVEYLADVFDSDDPKLCARNALRRPVSCGWVERVGRGQYRISERGRKRLARV